MNPLRYGREESMHCSSCLISHTFKRVNGQWCSLRRGCTKVYHVKPRPQIGNSTPQTGGRAT